MLRRNWYCDNMVTNECTTGSLCGRRDEILQALLWDTVKSHVHFQKHSFYLLIEYFKVSNNFDCPYRYLGDLDLEFNYVIPPNIASSILNFAPTPQNKKQVLNQSF